MQDITTEEVSEGKFTGVLKHLDKIVASSTLILIFFFGGFYYITNSTLSSHTLQIEKLDKKISSVDEKLGDMKFFPVKSAEEIKSMKELIGDIKEHQEKSDDRLNKIYDLLIEMNNKRR